MRRTLLMLSVAIVLVVSACGGGGRPLAVVNGQEVTVDDMVKLDESYEDVGEFEQSAFVDDLGLFVLLTAVETAARDQYGIEVGESEVDAFFDDPTASMAEQSASLSAALADGSVTEGQARANAKSFLVRLKVAEQLAADSQELQNLWDESPQSFYSACVRHIITQFEEDASAAVDRLEAGEEFATVAAEVSLDTQSEGGLLADPETGDCMVPLGLFVPEFGYQAATAPIGELAGPFVSDFGWHILIVEEREGPASFDEVLADLDRYLTDDVRTTLLNPWLNEALDSAVVDVDPSIGTWSEEANAISPAGG